MAIMWALQWCDGTRIGVCFDSMAAASIAIPRATPGCECKLGDVVATLFAMMCDFCTVVETHVKAHSGDPFNDTADALCTEAYSRGVGRG